MASRLSSFARRIVRRIVRGRDAPLPDEVERAEWACYAEILAPGMVALDVGAHVGEVTLAMSRFVGPSGRVHAFEPTQATFEKLEQVVRLSGRTNVVLTRAAVRESDGTAELRVYDEGFASWNTLADRPLGQGVDVKPVRTESVPATTLDSYCDRAGLSRIDFLKIDVEGAEYQVLLGARRLLDARRIRTIIFEIGQTTIDMGNDPEAIARYLDERGYRTRNVVPGAPPLVRRLPQPLPFAMHLAWPA
jgi:FkbM family methyltransferase